MAPSASRLETPAPLARSAAVAACAVLLGAGVAGCSTTQEKADKQQARAAHILRERAKREARKKQQKAKKHDGHGPGGKSGKAKGGETG